MSSSLPSFHLSVLVLLALCTTAGVDGCSVTPSAAAVVAGDDLSLTCMTNDTSEFINTWRLERDAFSALVLFQSPSINQDGSIREKRKVADGYLVNDSDPRQVILTIINASTVQANYYYCMCKTRSADEPSAFAYVSVLGSEPTFSNATEITDGKPVIFTCSVSFNGSANTSIIIEDSSLKRFSTDNYVEPWRGLHSFSLDYNATADSHKYQEFSCDIKLTYDTLNSIIYSKKLNASVEWVSVRNVQINPVNGTRCSDGKDCNINQKVRCASEANPKPVTFQWLMSLNGSRFNMSETSGDQFTFTTTGNYALQCVAFNEIMGIRYNGSSSVFKTQVVVDASSEASGPGEEDEGLRVYVEKDNNALIIGLVVGLLGSVIAAAIIALTVVYCRRKRREKRQQTETGIDPSPTLDEQLSPTSGTDT